MSGLSESDIQQLLLDCITLSQEADAIWGRKWSMMTWLYAFTRYNGVLLSIATFLPISSLESCKAGQYIIDILDATQFFCLASFSALRVYALMDGKILVTGIVLFLNLVPVGTNLVSGILCVGFNPQPHNGTQFFYATRVIVMDISLGTRISVIIGDVLVLIVTWSKTAKSYYEARQLRIKSPLATLLFRDGTFYFVVLLIINVLQVIGNNIPSLFTMQVSAPFFDTLPPLIVCRFILNLRQVKPAGSSWISGNQSGSLRFVGNAGEPLRFGADEEPEEEDENAVERLAKADEPDVVAQDIIKNNKDIANYDIDFSGQPYLQMLYFKWRITEAKIPKNRSRIPHGRAREVQGWLALTAKSPPRPTINHSLHSHPDPSLIFRAAEYPLEPPHPSPTTLTSEYDIASIAQEDDSGPVMIYSAGGLRSRLPGHSSVAYLTTHADSELATRCFPLIVPPPHHLQVCLLPASPSESHTLFPVQTVKQTSSSDSPPSSPPPHPTSLPLSQLNHNP
ncbi:hypothetical protein BDY19DRAFT_907923 [Irpex rosettiformis]|uniref:Uncharacterized protein n=1 Tax=Irpex rosettiformis TaxID=378272 RepID=A0ACB8TXM1_9APHY|nr:hypothetical protein BDY19DRAFT_907923 [Irpex rosettiformis]